MESFSLSALEWPHLLDQLAKHAVTRRGQARCRALEFATDLEGAWRLQQETDEARRLIEADGKIPLGGVMDIREHVGRAVLGSVLEPSALLEVGTTVRAARVLRQYAQTRMEQAPRFWEIVSPLPLLGSLEQAIEQTFRQDGSVHDHASADLARIRTSIRDTQAQIRHKLQRILQNAQYKNVIQESVVTMRDGRYLVPVKVEGQSTLKGVVHDQSASGATVYLEPMAVVEENNKLRRLEAEERAEIERLLTILSAQVAQMAGSLTPMADLLAEVDLISARATFAIALHAEMPKLSEHGVLQLRRARHPLLIVQMGHDRVVPLDIEITYGHSLVVTGPNTGGKTVALKTVGLFALMAKSGMQIPALPESQIPIFATVLADIGDEQSLEQSLSTFSGHMHHLVSIMNQADGATLVLLDEIGTGTDPAEGAALAQAIIEALRDRRVTTMLTTHYGSLKAMAYHQERIHNAATEFDDETLAPTYRLLMGQPGRSNALAITRRLGLADGIIERAHDLLGLERQDLESVISELSRERQAAELERRQIREVQTALDAERAMLADKERALEAERTTWREAAQKKLEADIAAARTEVARMVKDLQKAGTAQQAQKVRDRLEAISGQFADGGRGDSSPVWEIGQQVIVARIGSAGKVASAPDSSGQVQVQLGAIKMMVPAAELKAVPGAPLLRGSKSRKPALAPSYSPPTPPSPPPMPVAETSWELDLRGQRAADALAELDRFLDQAYTSNHKKLYIIHGKGTGALRASVADYLKDSPYVRDFRGGTLPEGGAGVTVVELT
jgi:DNA mismatch repair protein MutS2